MTPPDPCPFGSMITLELGPLIPGLPDDIALTCLLRLPIDLHSTCRAVCRRWRHLLAGKEHFFTQRRALGFSSYFLFAFATQRSNKQVEWHVLDLTNFCWHTIPTMPGRDCFCPHGFDCVAIPQETSFLVCGGIYFEIDCPLQLVMKFEVCRNRWTVMNRMHAPRSFFGGGVIDGMIYVAGGFSTDQCELDSAEVFDPAKGTWHPIANMLTVMSSYDSAVLDGKLYVTEGWFWPILSSPKGQVYDPKTDTWESMAVGMREGWTGLSVILDGRLFVIYEHEGMRVRVYDTESDSWDTVEGFSMPERIIKPFTVSVNGWTIYVVGRGLHVAIGFVQRERFVVSAGNCMKSSYSIRWHEIDVPLTFSDLTPTSTHVFFV